MTRALPAAFNPEMVRAILSGAKTQTRRPMKPQPEAPDMPWPLTCAPAPVETDGAWYWKWYQQREDGFDLAHTPIRLPWKIGDILYVRERTRVIGYGGRTAGCGMPNLLVEHEADNTRRYVPWPDRIKPTPLGNCLANGCYQEAARIYLRVTGVRAEVVGDISEEDARAEGMTGTAPRDAFRGVWDSIYATKDLGFDSGCWCWPYDLELLSTTGRPTE